jgi:hypothetical protein
LDTRTTYEGDTVFRPEVFFLGRTEGSGVVCDPFGRVARRCAIVTSGAPHAAYGAIHFDETFTYDDGEVDVWRWAITCGADGQYVAAEAAAGTGIAGQRQGDDYVFSFRRPVGRARGLTAPTFTTRLTLLAPDLALKAVRVSLFGAPVASMTAIHRRLGD